jgi:heme a synthase
MKHFVRAALAALGVTWFLIFIGGLVRVSGAGLGCPDWPHCFGGWLPPFNEAELTLRMIEQAQQETQAGELLRGLNPAHFNYTLAWIEYLNRLVGVVCGFCMLVLVAMAWRIRREQRRLWWWSLAALAIVIFEGGLGALVVRSELNHWLVSIHLGVALMLVSLLIYLTLAPGLADRPRVDGNPLAREAWWLWGWGIVQIALGAYVRGTIEQVQAQLPLLADRAVLDQLGLGKFVHIGLGIALAVASLHLAVKTLRSSHGLARQAAWVLAATVVLQVAIGFSFRPVGIAPLLQLAHLWIGSLWVGAAWVLALVLPRTATVADAAGERRTALWLGLGVGGALALALLGLGTIGLAEASRQRMPVIGEVPAFVLHDPAGEPVTEAALRGKVTVLSFMFTRCPAICPMMSAQLRRLYRLYEHGPQVQFLSVTVDPAYDSAEVLAAYAQSLGVDDARWRFLRTDDVATLAIWAERGFHATGNFPNHSTKLMLIDAAGRLRGHYQYDSPAEIDVLKTHIRYLARELPSP